MVKLIDLIDTLDMYRALDWSLHEETNKIILRNVGSKNNNFKIKDLAVLVAKNLENVR